MTDPDQRLSAATAKQRRVWDRAAPAYDTQIAFFDRFLFAGGREWIGARARGAVLEVGIGTGRNLAHYPPGVDLSAIDLSPAMLEIARDRAVELGLSVDLREEDAARLPWKDASFDTVVSALCLCSVPDAATAIAEMYRVLKPGGHVLLLDHVVGSTTVLRGLQWLVERVTIPLAGEHFTRRQLPLVLETGFTVVESERLKFGSVERIDAVKPVGG